MNNHKIANELTKIATSLKANRGEKSVLSIEIEPNLTQYRAKLEYFEDSGDGTGRTGTKLFSGSTLDGIWKKIRKEAEF